MSDLMMDDVVQQHFTAALRDLEVNGVHIPVCQVPGGAGEQTWVSFNEASGLGYTASNEAQRIRHLVQLHAWTHSQDDEHRAAFFAAVALLKAAGVRVYAWGPDEYEKDTGISHIACTCSWWQSAGA